MSYHELKTKIDGLNKEHTKLMQTYNAAKTSLTYVKDQIEELEEEIQGLEVIIIEISMYEDPEDEHKCSSEWETTDVKDKRFKKLNMRYGHVPKASAYAWDGVRDRAIYSMEENLLNIIANGPCKFTLDNIFGDSPMFVSEVIESPNHAQGLAEFFKGMHAIKDRHHCFLEAFSVSEPDEEGVRTIDILTGS